MEMWKVTLSKSETIWSIEVGVALIKCQHMLLQPTLSSEDDVLGSESVFQQALNEYILVVEEEHGGSCGGSKLGAENTINAKELLRGCSEGKRCFLKVTACRIYIHAIALQALMAVGQPFEISFRGEPQSAVSEKNLKLYFRICLAARRPRSKR